MSDDEIMEQFARTARTVVTATAQIRERMERANAQRDRESAQRLREGTQMQEQQFKVWVAQQQESYKRVGWHDWEDAASSQEWADAYTAARGMRDVDPRAVAAANRIEDEYKKRFGVDIRDAWSRFEEAEKLRAEAASRSPQHEREAESVEDLTREVRPEYAGVSKEEWRRTATTEDWMYAYANARAAETLDPVAKMAVQRIEEEVQTRFGTDIRECFDSALAAKREHDAAEAESARDDAVAAREDAQEARVDVAREKDTAVNGQPGEGALKDETLTDHVLAQAAEKVSPDATQEEWRAAVEQIVHDTIDGQELSTEERDELTRLVSGDRDGDSERAPEVTELAGVAREEEERRAADTEKADPSTLVQHSPDVQRAEAKQSTADREVERAEDDEQKAENQADSSLTESRASRSNVTAEEVNKADQIVAQGSAGYKPADTQIDGKRHRSTDPKKGKGGQQAADRVQNKFRGVGR